MRSAREIVEHLCALQNEAQRQVLVRFFKTAPGQYGHGDQFLGIKVGHQGGADAGGGKTGERHAAGRDCHALALALA